MSTLIQKPGRDPQLFDYDRLSRFVERMTEGYPHLPTDALVENMYRKISSREEYDAQKITNELLLNTQENIGAPTPDNETHPDWTYVSANIYLEQLYKKVARLRGYEGKYGDFLGLLKMLGEMGIYSSNILASYDEEEIKELGNVIDPENDKKFTYIGLRTLADRYLATDHNKIIHELPQERFMIIAMTLLVNEPVDKRIHLVKESYWALSNLYMTVATPTLANSGKSHGQLSSCFIDTVDDSLRGIYDSNTDIATLSKSGGGIGVYLGKVRAHGSDIKGYKGVAGGVMGWMKQLNNTAVSVDQLGQRQGSIAVYMDTWHKDIFRVLEARLNTGDERQRTHDLFTGVCIPDLFMEKVEKREDWYLFDPHQVRSVMGWNLEDFYDEEEGKGSFRDKYWECVDHPDIDAKRVPAIDIMKAIMRSQLETGTPYMFYRDETNRKNPNKHKGMVYCSNLCTEITQNQSPTTVDTEVITTTQGEDKIITVKTPGDFVVCNLSSINLGKAVKDKVLKRLIPIQVRMLDNVIDINDIEVLQAQVTNYNYRGIGLGTFGWHHLLTQEGIRWESQEAVDYCDSLYEEISYLTLKASHLLAVEKEPYPYFEGSDFNTGKFFEDRDMEKGKWGPLKEAIMKEGIRNGYLQAVAPNGSTSIIAGSTASIDPVMLKEYSEEKKNYKIQVTAPDLSAHNFFLYKNAHAIDQHWSIKQNGSRQKYVDQSISFNLYVRKGIQAIELLNLHLDAWKSKLKSTYYVRGKSSDKIEEECEACT